MLTLALDAVHSHFDAVSALAIIVHEKPDTYGASPSGAAGRKIVVAGVMHMQSSFG